MKDLGHVTGQRVHKTRGSQRDAFDHRVEAQYERLCRQAAQQAGAIYARERLQAIFLVGKDHLIELIEKDFPKELRHRVTLIKEDLGRSSVHELQNRLEPEIEKSTRLNSSHTVISYAVFCLKKKKKKRYKL